jgi:glutamyl-tRNA synthetase
VVDGITHVIRGPDHVSNTPKQINILRGLGADVPVYAHVPNVNGGDGRKLSKRHGAVTVEEFRANGYLSEALVNFLALLGWSYDDRTTIMSRDELVERFSLDRVGASPATFDYQKLDWMNGVYLRALPADEFAARLVTYLRERGIDWDAELARRAAPLVQEKIETLARFPEFARFLFEPVEPMDGFDEVGRRMLERSASALADVEPFEAEPIERALRTTADELGLKPRQAFQPIRVAVTGSTVSPGLFESLELLGRDESLERIRRAAGAGA